MSEEEINKLIEENLPTEIDGFRIGIGIYNDFCTIIYSKEEYIKNINIEKNKILLDIITNFKLIRKGYKELTENHIEKVKDADSILIKEIKSDEFEVFYKHFDMKSYNKAFLERYNLSYFKLAETS